MSVPKIDVHVHAIYHPEIALPRPDGTNYPSADELISMYDLLGIECGNLLPEITNECCTAASTSEEVCLMTKEHPDRFFWSCNFSPRMIDNSPSCEFGYALEHYKKLGARSVGEVCANLPFDDPLYEALWEACAACDLPVIIHMAARIGGLYGIYDEIGLPRMEKVLKKYPKLRIIGHSQVFWAEMSGDVTEEQRGVYPTGKVVDGRLHELLRNCPNLFCDLSAGSGCNALLRDEEHAFRFIEEFRDRLMFGTDICRPGESFPLSRWLDDRNADGCISDETYYKICRGNTVRELKLPFDF